MPTTLVISNDFPPRIGGIERFVEQVCGFCDGDVVVLTSEEPGSAAYDARLPFEVVRRDPVLLPTPAVGRTAAHLLRRTGATRVLFGASAPLGLLAPGLRSAGAGRVVALSHGHETWWARLPGSRALLRRIGHGVDVLTTISDHTTRTISRALDPADRSKLVRLPPSVDTEAFAPVAAPVHHPPRCVVVGRLVRRKGIDTVVRAWPAVRRAVPGAELHVVGDGPEGPRLAALARRLGVDIAWLGPRDPAGTRAALHDADVFALPVRVRLRGLDTEGLGLAALEAAACGLPVVVGRSGGAPETVVDGSTGFVVPPDDPATLAGRLIRLLGDPALRATMGAAGRCHVERRFSASAARTTLRALLELDPLSQSTG